VCIITCISQSTQFNAQARTFPILSNLLRPGRVFPPRAVFSRLAPCFPAFSPCASRLLPASTCYTRTHEHIYRSIYRLTGPFPFFSRSVPIFFQVRSRLISTPFPGSFVTLSLATKKEVVAMTTQMTTHTLVQMDEGEHYEQGLSLCRRKAGQICSTQTVHTHPHSTERIRAYSQRADRNASGTPLRLWTSRRALPGDVDRGSRSSTRSLPLLNLLNLSIFSAASPAKGGAAID